MILKNNKGFTLIEILVSLLIFSLAMIAIYSTFRSQHRSYYVQEQVVAMQQNIRAAMFMMEKELRMAGYDPTGSANSGIITATATSINFTKDLNSNGNNNDSNENITYSLYTADGIQKLGRKNPTQNEPIAENFDAIDFTYLDNNNAVLDDGGGTVSTNISNITSIIVSIVAKSRQAEEGYNNTNAYNIRLPDGSQKLIYQAPGDNFRRRLLSSQIKCRNLSLN